MRSRSYFIMLLTIVFSGCLKYSTEISGKLHNHISGEYVFLEELRSNELITTDSSLVTEDGTFSFEIDIEKPAFYLIKLNQYNFFPVLAEKGEKISIEALHDSLNVPISVRGSRGTGLLAEYNRKMQSTISKLYSLNSAYMRNTDTTNVAALVDSLDRLAATYLADLNSYTKNFIDDNITSLASLFALYQQVAPGVNVLNPSGDIKYFVKVDSSLSKLYPDYEPVKALHLQVEEFLASSAPEMNTAKAITIGSAAPDIALPGPLGDTIKLSSTKGSYVLLDFWASWCGPCRQENPSLVKAYNMFRNKGFRIYQVSLDKSRDAWLEGIKTDNLDRWIHVSDLKYWQSEVVPLYRFEKIPSSFLLDPEGRIIAVDLRGENLQAKLAELLNK